MAKITHKIFCWKTNPRSTFENPEPRPRYHYSIRPVTNTKNAVDFGRYQSRQGRNSMVNRKLELYKGKAVAVRDMNPNKK